MATEIRVRTGYVCRPQFVDFHRRKKRWAIAVCHRRAGKTVASFNDLLDAALRCEKQRPRFAYLAPFLRQAKAVVWDYARAYAGTIPGTTFNEVELRCDLPNEGQVRLFGADNYEALRGIYLDGVVLDEFGDMHPRAWSEVIRPALADRGGWAVFIGSARGRNHFAQQWEKAKADPDWFTLMLKASETDILPAGELADAAAQMSPEEYAAEFECSFDAPVVGSYYGKIIAQLEADKRVAGVGWEPAIPVHTAWDLGIGDSTAIWFVQQVGRETRVIDYYESSGVGLDHYANVLRSKPYVWGEHILPHDADVRELGTGKTRIETLKSLGIGNGHNGNSTRVIPALPVDDGINAVRLLLPKCWFDAAKCQRGLDALRQYRREYDEKTKAFRSRPLHDWTSHGSDAFRYLALGLQEPPQQGVAAAPAREWGWG